MDARGAIACTTVVIAVLGGLGPPSARPRRPEASCHQPSTWPRAAATPGTPATGSATPCATISHTVSQAASGDTIDVAGTIDDHVTIATSLTITQWPGQAAAVVDGTNSGTPFIIDSGATVSLGGFTIEHGNDNGLGGGGIRIKSSGALTVTDSTISDNTGALGGFGVGTGGGGIFNTGGTLTVTDSTIANNTADTPTDGGGGIDNYGGPLTVTDSTITDNSAPDGGGGITNSGGGSVTITASTIANNSAHSGNGGGLSSFGGTWTVGATIVAANTGGNCSIGFITSVGYNLTDDTSSSACGFTDPTDVLGADPQLGSWPTTVDIRKPCSLRPRARPPG